MAQRNTGRAGRFARHPLVLLAVTVLILGLVLPRALIEIRDQRRLAADQERVYDAARDIARRAGALIAAQDGLARALAGDRPGARIAAEARYFAAHADWAAGAHGDHQALRRFFAFTYPSFLEQALTRGLDGGVFAVFRACAARAPDDAAALANCLAENGFPATGTRDPLENHRVAAARCTAEILDTLGHFAARNIKCPSAAWDRGAAGSQAELTYQALMAACAGEGTEPDIPPMDRYEAAFGLFCHAEAPGPLQRLLR